MRNFLVLITFFLVGWFLFTYKLTDVPLGINGDEAAIGYSSALIAKTGYDSNGRFLPLFTTTLWPDWKQPVTIYSTVLMFKLFGISYFNLKAVSVLFVLISGAIIYLLAEEIFDKKMAVISLFLYSTIPLIMIQSHLAIENIAPLPFVSFWLLMLAKYTKIKKTKYLIFGAIALGISLYSYLGLRLIMPVLVILTIAYIYYLNNGIKLNKGNIKLRPILIFTTALLPFLALLLIVKNQYPAAVFALNKTQNIVSYQDFFLPFISSFDLSFLFLKGDSTPYHSTGKEGMFLLATLPLFILGLYKIAVEKKPLYIFIFSAFFLSPILYGLPGSVHRASRLMSLIPFFIIIILLGFKILLELKTRLKFYPILLVGALIVLNYKFFLADYWFDYPHRVNQSFEKPAHIVYEKAAKISKNENLKVYLHDDITRRHPTAYLFFELAYLPENHQQWEEAKLVPAKSIVMVTDQVFSRSLKNIKEVEVLEHGNMDIILVINRSNEDTKI